MEISSERACRYLCCTVSSLQVFFNTIYCHAPTLFRGCLRFDDGNQVPTTQRVGRCSHFVKCSDKRIKSCERPNERETGRRRFLFRRSSSRWPLRALNKRRGGERDSFQFLPLHPSLVAL